MCMKMDGASSSEIPIAIEESTVLNVPEYGKLALTCPPRAQCLIANNTDILAVYIYEQIAKNND